MLLEVIDKDNDGELENAHEVFDGLFDTFAETIVENRDGQKSKATTGRKTKKTSKTVSSDRKLGKVVNWRRPPMGVARTMKK